MKAKDYAWMAIGLAAVAFSIWILVKELRGISIADVMDSLSAIEPHQWGLAILSTLVAYLSLAGYDHIALRHLRKSIPFTFIALCSFTTYALAHNIGASVVSGAVVRYRAYSSRGLTTGQVALLVAFCSFTFGLAVTLLGGIVLVSAPGLAGRYFEGISGSVSIGVGAVMLALVALYVAGSWLKIRPLTVRRFELQYPSLPIVLRQLTIGPIELLAAAGIIYFTLPEAGNPGFLIVLGIFLASFSVALLSHAPGGLGVLEVVFLIGLADMNQADVLASLLVFRLLYLLIPFALSLGVILGFERSQLLRVSSRRKLPGSGKS